MDAMRVCADHDLMVLLFDIDDAAYTVFSTVQCLNTLVWNVGPQHQAKS